MTAAKTAHPKAVVALPHSVTVGSGPLLLYRGTHPPFIRLMDRLYPRFIDNSNAARSDGYSAFLARDGEPAFVGTFCGITLQSVRRNPWFPEEGSQWFVRALLAGLMVDGYAHHSSVCKPDNYGTLRLWQKLGLGARLDAAGKTARSALASADSVALRDRLIAAARQRYLDDRARVQRLLPEIEAAKFVPTPGDFPGQEPTRCAVELCQ